MSEDIGLLRYIAIIELTSEGEKSYLKINARVLVVLFMCVVYEAVHMAIVTNISTEGFIQEFRWFTVRRHRPSTIHRNNRANFREAKNLLKSLD